MSDRRTTRFLLLLALLCAGVAWFDRAPEAPSRPLRSPSIAGLVADSGGQKVLVARSAEKVLLDVRESLSPDSLVHASKGGGRSRPQGAVRLELDPHHLGMLRGLATRARGLAVAHLEFAASLSAARSGSISFHATATPPPALDA